MKCKVFSKSPNWKKGLKYGYIIIEDFLDAEELEIWRAAVDEAVTGYKDIKLVRYFLLGTHKLAKFDNIRIQQEIATIFNYYLEWAIRNATPAVMKAGTCSFHNGLIAHGAGPNMTPGYRRAMTCAYMPDGQHLQRSAKRPFR